MDEIDVTDIPKVWGFLSRPSDLNNDENYELAKKVFLDVTGQELNRNGCMGCKGEKYRRPFKYYAKEKYGIELR